MAYDPDSGRQLWSCRGMKECVGPSTAFGHGLVYASSGRIGPVMGIDPSGTGDVTETHVRLHLTSGGPYVPTPLVYPHLLVPGDNGRMLFYDGAGRLVVEGRVHDHFSSSPIGADGKIYWASERGKTYVIDATKLTGERPAVEVLAVNPLSGVCMATPAIVGGRLFIRTSEAMYCIGPGDTSGPLALRERARVRAGEREKSNESPAHEALTPSPSPILSQATSRRGEPDGGSLAELKRRYEQHLAHYQNEEEARNRLETLEAIARLDGPEVIEFLLHTAQKEEHWDICEEAAKALGRKGLPAVDGLILLLPDSRPFIRTIAINELGRLKIAQAVPGILKATRDRQPLVRSASFQALARIGLEETPQLAEILAAMTAALAKGEKEEPVVRQSALEGLALLAPKAGEQRQAVIAVLAAVAEERNPELAKRSREVLEKIYKATPAEIDRAAAAAVVRLSTTAQGWRKMGTGSVAQVGLAAGETLPPRCLSPFSLRRGIATNNKSRRGPSNHRRSGDTGQYWQLDGPCRFLANDPV